MIWGRCVGVPLFLAWAACAQAGELQEGAGASAPAESSGKVGIELGLGLLGEAWNLNGSREWLLDGTLGVWWAPARRATVLVEAHAARVFQQAPRSAFVTGVTPVLRVRTISRPAWHLLAEIGAGVAWSDTVVPPRGTRFNYLGLAGLGLAHRVGRGSRLVTGFRWFHLSNNGREGRDRNPDIQALGAHVALMLAF